MSEVVPLARPANVAAIQEHTQGPRGRIAGSGPVGADDELQGLKAGGIVGVFARQVERRLDVPVQLLKEAVGERLLRGLGPLDRLEFLPKAVACGRLRRL